MSESKPKRVRKKCVHNKDPYNCVECGGKGICEHKRRKRQCIDCGGAEICDHKRIRSQCKECKGNRFCKHERMKSYCKDCKGSSICDHNKIRDKCKECNGSSICEHNKYKYTCIQCKGTGICKHNIRKAVCMDCGGQSLCEHGKQKPQCKECGGSSYCEHNLFRSTCIHCTPKVACKNCQFVYVGGTRSRYKPYCFPCYCVLHPDEEIPRRYRLKENYVAEAIQDQFNKDFTITLNKIVEGGCSKRRPDIRIDFGSHCLMIEIDENRHLHYLCEEKRMIDLYEDVGFRKCVFLRFNPDGYRENGIRYSTPFTFTKAGAMIIKKDEMERRMNELIQRIHYFTTNEPIQQLTIEYLFYGEKEEK